MNEAMELASSIANMDLDLRLRAVFDDKATELARITTECLNDPLKMVYHSTEERKE